MHLRDFHDIHTHRFDAPCSVLSLRPEQVHACPSRPFTLQLHPWHLSPDFLSDFQKQAPDLLASPFCLGIGECGLDYVSQVDRGLQCRAFECALQMARRHNMPTIVHCVRAWEDMIAMVRKVWGRSSANAAREAGCEIIVHGFVKKKELAHQLLVEGFSLSIGERFNAEALAVIPDERLYFETDESERSIVEIMETVRKHRLSIGKAK